MSIIAWITAAFGALVVGVAVSSVLDELLSRVTHLQPRRWSLQAILRGVATLVLAAAAMALWGWLWLRYVAG
ncbi:MAG: hypothetical protein ACE5HA_04845 [Anaerolineae bacterium]